MNTCENNPVLYRKGPCDFGSLSAACFEQLGRRTLMLKSGFRAQALKLSITECSDGVIVVLPSMACHGHRICQGTILQGALSCDL